MKTQTQAVLQLVGRTPLVMNNAQLADPACTFTVQIKALTDKGSRITAEEREQKETLQWRGSLYLAEDGSLIVPARNFTRAIRDAAKAFREGVTIERGGMMVLGTDDLVLFHDGPGAAHEDKATGLRYGAVDLHTLFASDKHRWRTVVNGNPTKGPGGGKVVMVRPVFPVWSLTLSVVVFHDMLAWDKFEDILTAAGRLGIGNARTLGYGRFEAKVVSDK